MNECDWFNHEWKPQPDGTLVCKRCGTRAKIKYIKK